MLIYIASINPRRMHEGYGIWFVCQSEAVITLALLPDTEYSQLVLTERQKPNQINMSHTTRLW